MMNTHRWWLLLLAMTTPALYSQRQPLTLPLECAGKDCSLLTGSPQTSGMRSGFVRLKPGESVGAHSTENQEETLVILRGKGEAKVEGRTLSFSSGMLVYIPPRSHHDVKNAGDEILEYVYVVAPIKKN
jgi:mannose-6-phosphate isomerase-like protein (cupin superfamily)